MTITAICNNSVVTLSTDRHSVTVVLRPATRDQDIYSYEAGLFYDDSETPNGGIVQATDGQTMRFAMRLARDWLREREYLER